MTAQASALLQLLADLAPIPVVLVIAWTLFVSMMHWESRR